MRFMTINLRNRTLRFFIAITVGSVALTLAMVSTQMPPASAASNARAARAAAPSFRLIPINGVRIGGAVWVGSAPNSSSTYYVVEQGGYIWAVTGTRKTRFLDVSKIIATDGEQGLLSMAFARDYATSGRFFIYYIARDGAGVIRQYRAKKGRVILSSARQVIRVPLAPPEATNHNGGNLWATDNGHLFLSVGDGGGGGVERMNSQRMNVLMGKIIRITPKPNGGYTIPRSNPFFSRAGARREIYALGLRNPWRFSIDEPTGDVWIGDVGQSDREEIDRVAGSRLAGTNFGWPRMEGKRMFDSAVKLASGTKHTPPYLDYGRSGGRCSVTGGVVYRGPVASMRGRYLYADFCSNRIWSVSAAKGARRIPITHKGVDGIVHFGELSNGNVIVASVKGDRLYRIAPSK